MEEVEVRAGGSVSEAVEELASGLGDESLSLPTDNKIADGEWVRFSVLLDDGTHVIAGVGRCGGALPRGNPVDHYDVTLTELQFDERNEIMFERLRIAKEAAKSGEDTGTVSLDDHSIDELKKTIPGVPPPPPAAKNEASKKDSDGDAPQKRPTPSVPPPKPKFDVSAAKPSKKESLPPKKASIPPKKASIPPKASEPPKRRPSVAPRKPMKPVDDGPHSMDVPSELVAQARRLESELPRRLLDPHRKTGKPEAAVLAVALRLGLGALEAIKED